MVELGGALIVWASFLRLSFGKFASLRCRMIGIVAFGGLFS